MAIATVIPSTGLIQSFESLRGAEIEAKLQRAADTLQIYRKVSFGERASWMLKAAAILEQEKEPYAKVMTTETGKTFRSAVKWRSAPGSAGRILGGSRVMAATLTGSEQAGIAVGVGAAKRIKKVVLELGGSDPFIAMPSANLEAAASTAVKARIFHDGQSCIAAKRFIVAESIADEFEQLFAKKMAALKVGDPFDASAELGPLSTPEGVHDLDRDGRKTVEAGAKILPKDSPAYQEELFGPVASVFRAKDIGVAKRLRPGCQCLEQRYRGTGEYVTNSTREWCSSTA